MALTLSDGALRVAGPVAVSTPAKLVSPGYVINGTMSVTKSELYFEMDDEDDDNKLIDSKVSETFLGFVSVAECWMPQTLVVQCHRFSSHCRRVCLVCTQHFELVVQYKTCMMLRWRTHKDFSEMAASGFETSAISCRRQRSHLCCLRLSMLWFLRFQLITY